MRKMTVYPEAIPRDDLGPGPWTIKNNQQGLVNLGHKVMAVPLVDMPCGCGINHAQGMRWHEYGHVAFTPRNGFERAQALGIEPGIANGCEDARLKIRLEEAMGEELVSPSCPGGVSAILNDLLTNGKFDLLMAAFASAHGSNGTRQAAREWRQAILNHDASLLGISQVMESAEQVMDELQTKDPPLYEDTLDAAKKLQYFSQAMQAVMDAIKKAAAEDAERAKRGEKERPGEIEELLEIAGDGLNPGGDLWGTMTIQHVPLTKPSRAYPQRKWTARDEGVLPSSMHRIATDGRIFKQASHRPEPLTVLVDCSGSMNWDWEKLQELLDRVPATTVGIYSGRDDAGVLRIVADKGKKADKRYVTKPSGASNTVDGIALRWLAKHKGRKLWVSDGRVNGYGGTGPQLHDDAAAVVIRNGIMRVDHHPEAMEVVTGKKPFRPTKTKDQATTRR